MLNPPTPSKGKKKKVNLPEVKSGKVGLNQPPHVNGKSWNAIRHLAAPGEILKGHKLVGMNFIFQEDKVLVILKKDSPQGSKVAFIDGASMDLCLWRVAQHISSKTLKWVDDKYKKPKGD